MSKKGKSFDTVAWMRKRREEIDKEDEGLSWEEKARKNAEILRDDPLWIRLKDRRVKAETPIRHAITEKD